MKKHLLVLLVLMLALALASCFGHFDTTSTTNKDQPIDPPVEHTHTEEIIPAVESTCTETGLTEGKKCSECGEILIDQAEAPLKSHTEEIIPAVEASCTEMGLSEGKKCSICDTVLVSQQETPIVAHTYDDKYDESCNECGFIRDSECAHRETETIKGYDSTCTSTGLTDGEKCKKCGEILVSQTVISVKEHTEVVDEAVEPTCTASGLTEGKHCDVCGAIIVEQNTINATGHTESDWIIDREATYEAEGSKHIECTVCGAIIKTETIEKLEKLASEGLEFALNDDGQSYSVVGIGECLDNNLIIPSNYNDLPVTAIADKAFQGCVSLKSVEIPESINSIGSSSFANCYSLSRVNVPSQIDIIEDYTFSGCTSLLSIVFPEGLKIIGQYAFQGCYSLTNITIPGSITRIDNGAFFNCYSLIAVCNKSDLKIVSGELGYGQIAANAKHVFADEADFSINYIRDCVFYDDGENVYLVKYLGEENNIILPEYGNGKQYIINQYAFHNIFTPIVQVVIPNCVMGIDNYAFDFCINLMSVLISDSVTSIGQLAFNECISLLEIINKSFVNIDVDVKHMINDESQSAIKSIDDYVFYDDGNEIYFVKYIGDEIDLIIPEYNGKIFEIYKYAFYDNYHIRSVVIPDSVTTIGDSAFCGTSLVTLTMGESVSNIANNAFYGSFNLIEIYNKSSYNIADNVGLGAYVKRVITDESQSAIKYVGDYAFYDDGNEIYLVRYFGNETNITLPEYDEGKKYEIYQAAFFYPLLNVRDNVMITSVTIPNCVTKIGESAFQQFISLRKVFIPKSVIYIDDNAFSNCISLTIYSQRTSPSFGWAESSRDSYGNVFGGWNPDDRPVVWGYGANDSDDPYVPDNPSDKIRYTITEDEWYNMLMMDNFTVAISQSVDGVDEEGGVIKITEFALQVDDSNMMVFYEGKNYILAKNGDEWFGYVTDQSFAFVMTDSEFDCLVYDEELKAYIDKNSGMIHRFENGVLVSIFYETETRPGVVMRIEYVVSDVGTTLVEIPEFTIVD